MCRIFPGSCVTLLARFGFCIETSKKDLLICTVKPVGEKELFQLVSKVSFLPLTLESIPTLFFLSMSAPGQQRRSSHQVKQRPFPAITHPYSFTSAHGLDVKDCRTIPPPLFILRFFFLFFITHHYPTTLLVSSSNDILAIRTTTMSLSFTSGGPRILLVCEREHIESAVFRESGVPFSTY